MHVYRQSHLQPHQRNRNLHNMTQISLLNLTNLKNFATKESFKACPVLVWSEITGEMSLKLVTSLYFRGEHLPLKSLQWTCPVVSMTALASCEAATNILEYWTSLFRAKIRQYAPVQPPSKPVVAIAVFAVFATFTACRRSAPSNPPQQHPYWQAAATREHFAALSGLSRSSRRPLPPIRQHHRSFPPAISAE